MSLAIQAEPQATASPAAANEQKLGANVHYLHLPAASAGAAWPVHSGNRLLGVLFLDAHADAVAPEVTQAVAQQVEAARKLLERGSTPSRGMGQPQAAQPRHEVRFHAPDSSVFVDGHYLIKGVAGALLWKFLNEYTAKGRTEFCYRELRLDPSLRLPDVVDNLGARLALLEQRLASRCPQLRIVRKARGLIAIEVGCALALSQA